MTGVGWGRGGGWWGGWVGVGGGGVAGSHGCRDYRRGTRNS